MKTFLKSLQGGAASRGLGLVDLDLGHSTSFLDVLGQMGVWLNWLCSWATWLHLQIKFISPTLYIVLNLRIYSTRVFILELGQQWS